ncbi:MAG: cyclic nucleotide-binding domain-containing protein [Candidatus Cloacimonadota bacterium]|nr:cyclic nucleotide-binding domain-containing protein [Candidatus Cloacimonadota bacterium]
MEIDSFETKNNEENITNIKILKKNKLLKFFDNHDIEKIKNIAKIEQYEHLDSIIVLGESNRDIFAVIEGEVSVWAIIKGKSIEMIKLGPGTIIGDMNFVIPTRRTANVSAIDDVTIIRFPYKKMLPLLTENQDIANKFFSAINLGLGEKTNQIINDYLKKFTAWISEKDKSNY